MSPGNSFGGLAANPCCRLLIRCSYSFKKPFYNSAFKPLALCQQRQISFHRSSWLRSAAIRKSAIHLPKRALSDLSTYAEFVQEDNNDSSSNRVSASAAGVAIKPSEGAVYVNASVAIKPSEDGVYVNPTSVRPERIYVTNVHPLEVERIQEERCTEFGLEGNSSSSSSAVKEEDQSPFEKEAWKLLRDAVVSYCGSPVGTVAANDPSGGTNLLNYDQVFIRDFVPSALAFMLRGETEIVRNFLLHTLQLQSWEKTVDCYSPGQGLMPASFKVRTVPLDGNNEAVEEVLDPDFGESAIGRVAPVDSGLWWIILLRAYGRITGDFALQERVDVQTGIKLILKLCLADGFDMFPTLLVTDGSCMIDRRMGIHGHPLEIQTALVRIRIRIRIRYGYGETAIFKKLWNLPPVIFTLMKSTEPHLDEYYLLDLEDAMQEIGFVNVRSILTDPRHRTVTASVPTL